MGAYCGSIAHMSGEVGQVLPGQLFHARTAMSVAVNTGGGGKLWALADEGGIIAMVRDLPTEVAFIDAYLSSSRRGGGMPIVVAYDPARVRII